MLLLQYNADPSIVNGSGETAKEVTHDKDIRSMLEGNFNRSKFVLFCFFLTYVHSTSWFISLQVTEAQLNFLFTFDC